MNGSNRSAQKNSDLFNKVDDSDSSVFVSFPSLG